MYRVRLIHWNAAEARQKADQLRAAGYAVNYDKFNPSLLRERENPPAAVVIDLSRLASQGRDVAMALRSYKTTRTIPVIFVAGEPEKVERIKAQIPDAVYANWDQVAKRLEQAITHPPEEQTRSVALRGIFGNPPIEEAWNQAEIHYRTRRSTSKIPRNTGRIAKRCGA